MVSFCKETTPTKTPKQSMNGRKRQDADGNQKFIRLVWLVVPRTFLDKHSLIKPSNLKSLSIILLSVIWLRYVHIDLENGGLMVGISNAMAREGEVRMHLCTF